MESPLSPETRESLLLIALYLSAALGGTLAYVHRLPYGRIGAGVATAALATMIVATAVREPILLPVVALGLFFVAAAGYTTGRDRARREAGPDA